MTGPALALAALEAVEHPHRGGHRCHDGQWWNDRAGTRTPCPVLGHLATARQQVHRLHEQVHAAAHDTPAAVHVAEAMTGLVMADLNPEDREGWTTAARMAIEGLAEWLDRDPVREARARALHERLASAGIAPGVTP